MSNIPFSLAGEFVLSVESERRLHKVISMSGDGEGRVSAWRRGGVCVCGGGGAVDNRCLSLALRNLHFTLSERTGDIFL